MTGQKITNKSKVALDAVACRIINLDCPMVTTFQTVEKAGLGNIIVSRGQVKRLIDSGTR
jgi:uncharacterized protein (DUF362 family)